MTLPTRRPRRGARLSRNEMRQRLDDLAACAARAEGRARATIDWAAAWLTSRADAYEKDAQRQEAVRPGDGVYPGTGELSASQRRAVAHELRDVAREIADGIDRGGRTGAGALSGT